MLVADGMEEAQYWRRVDVGGRGSDHRGSRARAGEERLGSEQATCKIPETAGEASASSSPRWRRSTGRSATSPTRSSDRRSLLEKLAPGEKLRQEELAAAIGISREPVRSAIVQLAADGLVVVNPHRGATVNVLSRERIREIYTLRVLLETHAVRLGIASMDEARLATLERLGEELDRAERSPSSVRLRTAFYDALYDAGRNPVLVEMIDRLRGDVGRYWSVRREASEHEHGHRPLARVRPPERCRRRRRLAGAAFPRGRRGARRRARPGSRRQAIRHAPDAGGPLRESS